MGIKIAYDARVTTFVLSQHPDCWNVHRLGEGVTIRAYGLPDEEDATEIALEEAKKEPPSQVLRISQSGDSKVIAQFMAD
ncbi:MAG: hypothetical protein ACHQNE_10480 [Candidatus Kapaibacterium sp.]